MDDLNYIKKHIQNKLTDATFDIRIIKPLKSVDLEVRYNGNFMIISINNDKYGATTMSNTDNPFNHFFTSYPDIEFDNQYDFLSHLNNVLEEWLKQ